jgi:hypothetical protein
MGRRIHYGTRVMDRLKEKLDMQQFRTAIYALYPKKMGKSQGFKTMIAQCKTMNDMIALEKAVMNYRDYIVRECVQPQYILYFKTFMNQWKDWLDENHGHTEEKTMLLDADFDL